MVYFSDRNIGHFIIGYNILFINDNSKSSQITFSVVPILTIFI